MIRQFETTIRRRVAIVFTLVHVGLVATIFATARLSVSRPVDGEMTALWVGIAMMYAAHVVGAFFLVWPLLPWYKRAHEAKHWAQTLMADLPRVLEMTQKTMDSLRPLVKTWMNESSSEGTNTAAPQETHPPDIQIR